MIQITDPKASHAFYISILEFILVNYDIYMLCNHMIYRIRLDMRHG